MNAFYQKLDRFLLVLLMVMLISMPVGIAQYNHYLWHHDLAAGTRVITLTGNVKSGWILGDFHAFNVLDPPSPDDGVNHPVIRVKKGERIVLKLESSDVVHGFSLKDLGIFVSEGIHPGRVTIVRFTADRTGTFTFSCNAICGKQHDKMKGTLVVTA
jgi:heme/copper-type cytochrome/quinol oxidase subunit 2